MATIIGVPKNVISRFNKATEGGNAVRKPAGGHGKIITPKKNTMYLKRKNRTEISLLVSYLHFLQPLPVHIQVLEPFIGD